MAKWVLEIPDELELRVIEALCRKSFFLEKDADARKEFAKGRVIDFVRSAVIEQESGSAAFVARLLAMEKTTNDIGDGLKISEDLTMGNGQ